MPDNEGSLNIDIDKSEQDANIEKEIRTDLNEAYIPDFQFTPPTPTTPPPVIVDSSNSKAATSESSENISK